MFVMFFPLSSKIKSSSDCQGVPPPGYLGELVLDFLGAELSFMTVIMNGSIFTSLGGNSELPLAKPAQKEESGDFTGLKYRENVQLFVL